ncbi:type 1 glutamine amidotransferase domain-containing protein [Megasphaera paucivorans]|uniref:Putative intracellular protease/amidase n=1 Tax=Megasphaera paucivorans TaxID=349095 RepID=A0A1G9QJE2_9FIRM|nr:type 1 glutamine amidotransferase domain-containing protein [Megasphaera paucivorans]SDM10617.1 Putative intracellular protease/amidase [Megasphaera paucivorans]
MLTILVITAIVVLLLLPMNRVSANEREKKVLMVVTHHDHFDNGRKTGLWLEEFAVPYTLFVEAGFTVTTASLQGGSCPIDPGSVDKRIGAEWKQAADILQQTEILSQINYQEYDALMIPGGHGPLYDLANSKALDEIISYFDAQNKIIAAVCHGTGTLLQAVRKDGMPVVTDKKITGFTNAEEILVQAEQLVPFSLEDRANTKGARFVAGTPWSDHIEIDGNLITGQNPQSSKQLGEAVVNAVLHVD